MILPSTLRKLRAAGATVHRVTIPAHVVTIGGQSANFPTCREYFADAAGARKFAANMDPRQWGAAVAPALDTVPAAALDPLFCRELDEGGTL